jgi:hypothetical protein
MQMFIHKTSVLDTIVLSVPIILYVVRLNVSDSRLKDLTGASKTANEILF